MHLIVQPGHIPSDSLEIIECFRSHSYTLTQVDPAGVDQFPDLCSSSSLRHASALSTRAAVKPFHDFLNILGGYSSAHPTIP